MADAVKDPIAEAEAIALGNGPQPAPAPQKDDISERYIENVRGLTGSAALEELMRELQTPDDLHAKERRREQQTVAREGSLLNDPKSIEGAKQITKDAATFAIEAPLRSVVGGIHDAGQEVLDLTFAADKWLSEKLPILGEPDPAAYQFDVVPDPGEPSTKAGQMLRGVVQFLTGFKAAGRLFRAGAEAIGAKGLTEAGGKAGEAARAAGKGAAADFAVFDPQQERLSDLWQDLGLPQNVLTDYLAADPGDGEIEGRLKNAVEGLGIGAAADGLLMAARTIRAATRAKAGKAPGEGAGAGLVPEIEKTSPRDFMLLGDPAAPLVSTKAPERPVSDTLADVTNLGAGDNRAPGEVAATALAKGRQEGSDLFINWARIDADADVKNVLGQMADTFKGEIDQARRGTQTFKQIELNAAEEDAWKILEERKAGQPLNAEQSLAVRTLWAMSGRKLNEVTRIAAENPSETNLFAFRKMIAIHATIQEQMIAARTETARATASWRIPVGSDALRFREIEALLDAHGGPEVTRALAKRMALLADNPAARDAMAERGFMAKTMDGVRTIWINALLSGPKTHAVNAMSNAAVLYQQMFERGTAARISSAIGTQGGAEIGESAAMWFGTVEAIKDTLRYAGKMARIPGTADALNPFDNPAANLARSKVDVRGAQAGEALAVERSGWLGQFAGAMDAFWQYGVQAPSNALEASDKVFKTLGYRAELNAQALRQATAEVQAGKIPAEEMKGRIADLVADPPESLELAAVDAALYNTFQNKPGKWGQAVLKARDAAGPLGWLVMPFARTPMNIARYTFERTPLAPLVGQWRADIAAGGARRDIALARMATGTAIMLAVTDLALSGNITGGGPEDRAMADARRRMRIEPYSVKVDGRWHSYQRADPLGMTMGLAADMVELLANSEIDKRDTKTMQEVAAAMAAAIGGNVMSKTYLEGVSNLFQAVGEGPTAGAAFNNFLNQLAGTVVPTGVAEVARQQDPYLREVRTMLDAIKNRTPGFKEGLPLRRDLWGRPISYESGLGWVYDATSPIYSKAEDPQPIDEFLYRENIAILPPNRVASFRGVNVDLDRHPGAYSRYLELQGQEIKDPSTGKNLLGTLNDLVTGRSAQSMWFEAGTGGADGTQAAMIKNYVANFREMARARLLDEFPGLAAEVRNKQAARMPQ